MKLPIFDTVKLAHVYYIKDMVEPNSQRISLAYIAKASSPDGSHWLGMLARTKLDDSEMTLSMKYNWPGVAKPLKLLDKAFSHAWDKTWDNEFDSLYGKVNLTVHEISIHEKIPFWYDDSESVFDKPNMIIRYKAFSDHKLENHWQLQAALLSLALSPGLHSDSVFTVRTATSLCMQPNWIKLKMEVKSDEATYHTTT